MTVGKEVVFTGITINFSEKEEEILLTNNNSSNSKEAKLVVRKQKN